MRQVSSKFEGSSMSFSGICASTIGLGALVALGSDGGHWLSGKIENAVNAVRANDEAMEAVKQQKKNNKNS